MRIDRFASRIVLIAAALTTACGSARRLEEATSQGGNCTGCHGGQENASGAPPYDRNHQDGTPAVGAHTRHVDAGVACDACHVVPASVGAPGHVDPSPAEVTFGGLARAAGASPTWSSSTCSGTYCHGATLHGGSRTTVDWSADLGRVGCGSCHGLPPLGVGAHVASPSGTRCFTCHSDTVDSSLGLRKDGKHLDGAVDTGFGVAFHPAGWATPANGSTPHGSAASYHERTEYPNGLADCRACHGDDLAGGEVNVSCDRCHPGFQTSCTFCHGDASRSAALRAAPPADTRGRTSPIDRGVGAHQTHLAGRSTGAISDGVVCEDCHRVPAGLEHVNGNVATVPDLSLEQPGTHSEIGTFDPADASCATTYCHGNFQNGKATTAAGNEPVWTQTGGQNACGTCHASQVGADATWGHRITTHTTIACSYCHVGGYGSIEDDPTLVNPVEHVNGSLNISGAVNSLGYSTTTHTCSRSCHGAASNGTPLAWTKATP